MDRCCLRSKIVGRWEYGQDAVPEKFENFTAVALDRRGRFLIILAPWGGLSLSQFTSYLLDSDLDIDVALNLDGGASTGLLLGEPEEGIPGFTAIPAVITVHVAGDSIP